MWDNGVKTWEPQKLVKIDYPTMVRAFEEKSVFEQEIQYLHSKIMKKKQTKNMGVHTAIKMISHFETEMDSRYWDVTIIP